jgi:hypothetical protein
MKKIIKRMLAIGLFLFIAMQFYQPARNLDNGQVYATDFTQTYPMSSEIKAMFQVSCYDCHSNNTNYLWYDYVQPARWLVEKHIRNAKKELNFNRWGTYSARKQERLLQSISEQVKTGQMPLRSYTALHQNAKLNQEQVETLVAWLKQQQ